MILQLNGQTRVETEQSVIFNLKRKGWIEVDEQVQEPSQEELLEAAKKKAESHILRFFSTMEMIGLLDCANQGSAGALQVRQWCRSIEQEALIKANPDLCDFEQFGEPLKYEEAVL